MQGKCKIVITYKGNTPLLSAGAHICLSCAQLASAVRQLDEWRGLKKKKQISFFFLVFQGYLPSVVLKRIILDGKTPLEKNLGAKIVTVKEIGWDQPNPSSVKPPSTSSSTNRTITVRPTTRQTHYSSFLPYVLVTLCLLAGLIAVFAFYR